MTYPYRVDIQRKCKSLQRRYSTTFAFGFGRDASLKRIPTMRFWWKNFSPLLEGLRLSRDVGEWRSRWAALLLLCPGLQQVVRPQLLSCSFFFNRCGFEFSWPPPTPSPGVPASNWWSGLSCSPVPSSTGGFPILLHQVDCLHVDLPNCHSKVVPKILLTWTY